MKDNSIDVSIIIVSFNTKSLLRQCLSSIYQSDLNSYRTEIFVYDNGSGDGSPEMVRKEFPQVKLDRGEKNIGYAAANNREIVKSEGRYVLLLNSDTVMHKKTLSDMTKFMDTHKDIGASTCKLVLPNGQMDPACHRGFPTPWAALTYWTGLEKLFPQSKLFGQYHQGYKDLRFSHEIDSPSGAFFLVRREVIEKAGMLDEDYFMYAEDLDWAYCIKQAGFKIIFNPGAGCLHYKKQSGRLHSERNIRLKTQILFHQNNLLFYKKHFEKKYGRIVSLFVYCAYDIRLFLLNHLHI